MDHLKMLFSAYMVSDLYTMLMVQQGTMKDVTNAGQFLQYTTVWCAFRMYQ